MAPKKEDTPASDPSESSGGQDPAVIQRNRSANEALATVVIGMLRAVNENQHVFIVIFGQQQDLYAQDLTDTICRDVESKYPNRDVQRYQGAELVADNIDSQFPTDLLPWLTVFSQLTDEQQVNTRLYALNNDILCVEFNCDRD